MLTSNHLSVAAPIAFLFAGVLFIPTSGLVPGMNDSSFVRGTMAGIFFLLVAIFLMLGAILLHLEEEQTERLKEKIK